MKHNVIVVKNLTRSFKRKGNRSLIGSLFKPDWRYKNAVSDASFTIAEGEAVAFLGPNGAGKTTTTKMMAGLVYPSSGSITVLGFTPQKREHVFLHQIGLVMGNKSGLNWDLTARQAFDLFRRIYDVEISVFQERVDRLCSMLDVEKVLDTQVRKLSLGERMKLELIGSLLHDPKILFLDEPTIGLDIPSKRKIREFLKQLHTEGKTLILTSHDMDDIAMVCNRALIINDGTIVYDGKMSKLIDTYDATRMVRIESSDILGDAELEISNGQLIERGDGWVRIAVDKSKVMDLTKEMSSIISISDITIEQVALEKIIEDVFNGKNRK